ncbi:hypothetical protein [Kiloniella antarctica]|uniref:DUF2147 domain-containing protein n=1 Tax=Kiloniella antarctica TaxID=1550907 RepID=A0ABW5BJF0_9PROT
MSESTHNLIDKGRSIGCVTYCFNETTGNLDAEWAFSAQTGVETICRGIATRQRTEAKTSKDNFVGKYSITYYGPDNTPADPWDLKITKKGTIFDLIWSKDNMTAYHGIGFLSGHILVCGWRPST